MANQKAVGKTKRVCLCMCVYAIDRNKLMILYLNVSILKSVINSWTICHAEAITMHPCMYLFIHSFHSAVNNNKDNKLLHVCTLNIHYIRIYPCIICRFIVKRNYFRGDDFKGRISSFHRMAQTTK